ncbi:MAG: hypothetical protein LLG00_13775 [Planctomycetaceae bacterium]|nr:hypothetical protein [Planctomycetaceae bacterium]
MAPKLADILPELEDAFGLSISDEEAVGLKTVGNLHDYVLAHRFPAKQETCLTSITFYKLRRALMSTLRLPRDQVTLSTSLSALLPRHRRRTWRAVEKTSGCHLPMLRRPRWVVTLATFFALALGIAVSAILGLKPFRGGVAVALLAAGLFGFVILVRLTEVFACQFPPDIVTVGDLAKATLARNYQPLLAESKQTATDAQVWEVMQRIATAKFGIPSDQLMKETSLV